MFWNYATHCGKEYELDFSISAGVECIIDEFHFVYIIFSKCVKSFIKNKVDIHLNALWKFFQIALSIFFSKWVATKGWICCLSCMILSNQSQYVFLKAYLILLCYCLKNGGILFCTCRSVSLYTMRCPLNIFWPHL